MIVQNETLFQWLVAAIGGVLTFLGSLAVRNNRERFVSVDSRAKDLADRVDKLEDRINNKLPEILQELRNEIKTLDGKIVNVNTKVDLISTNVIDRMDKLEKNLPSLIEGALYKFAANGKFSALGGDNQEH
jgi:predicted nuclease with TOPRIM domain